jgi:hypothetical protein
MIAGGFVLPAERLSVFWRLSVYRNLTGICQKLSYRFL